jgi:hypothetical protein
MTDRNIIRIYFKSTELNIKERASFIVEKQAQISESLDKFDWLLFDKTSVNLKDKDYAIQLFLKRIKKGIKTFTSKKNIPEDYFDTISCIDGYYASRKFDNDASFTYTIGHINASKNASSLIITNFDCLKNLSQFEQFKTFIMDLITIFQPYSIEVSEYAFYRERMNLKSDEYWFGWLTYFSKYIEIPRVIADAEIEELNNGGKLLIVTKEYFNSENPEHLKRAKSLTELFRRSNVKPLVKNL